MFKLLVLASVLTSTVLAQATVGFLYFFSFNFHIIHCFVQATNDSSVNPLIPNGISQNCTTFLIALNADISLNSCLSTLTNITSAFAPGATTPTSSDVTSTLTNLCADSATSACPESLIRTQITAFYSACPAELTTGAVQAVRTIYEVLYVLLPLQESICSKDSSGNWCASGPTTTTRDFDEDALSISEILALLYIKTDNGALTRRGAAIVPNLDAIVEENSQFLFYTANLSQSQMCTPCLRAVLTSYINFESNVPLAYEMNSSMLLGSQSALYNAVQSKCPANFLSGAVEAAGGLSGGTSSAIPTYGTEYQRVLALVMGAVTLAISVAL
jgi:hypothetical protein